MSLLITVGDAAWAARHTAGCRRGRGGTLALEMREAVKPFIVPRSPFFFYLRMRGVEQKYETKGRGKAGDGTNGFLLVFGLCSYIYG